MPRFKLYFYLWWKLSSFTLMEIFINRWTNALFFFGKALRFGVSLVFILTLREATTKFAGYTTSQMLIFFLSYQFLDTLMQVFLRGVYLFSWQIRSGELDFYLAKPIDPLFRILTGKTDIIDALFLIPATALSIWLALPILGHTSLGQILGYFLLLGNGFLIALSFHIFVICLGVLTTEVDNAIMLYRDLNNMGRFPVDVYSEPLRLLLFFVVPIGIMNTVPAQVLLNTPPTVSILTSCAVGLTTLILSLKCWQWSLKRYTSAGG